MFGIDWADPQTMWLNIANLVVGLATVGAVIVLLWGVAVEIWHKAAKRRSMIAGLDTEVNSLVRSYDAHSLHLPDLGLTMADGGDPAPKAQPKAKRARKRPTR